MLLLLLACHGPLAVVSDLHGDAVHLVDLGTGGIRYTYDVDGHNVDECRVQDDQHRFCLVYQSRHRLTDDGQDEIVYTYSPVADDSADPEDVRGRVVGVAPTDPPSTRWQLDRLDWSLVDPDRARCAWDAADPCAVDRAVATTEAAIRACQLFWPHDLQILGEDPDFEGGAGGVRLVLADTRNDRLLWVTASRQSTCGLVTEVLDHTNPDWDLYASINGVDTWEDGTTRRLLFSAKDAHGDGSQLEGTWEEGAGKGKIVQWRDDGEGWVQEWEFPPQSSSVLSFVNSPHGVTHDDGHVYFAHALGSGDTWNVGAGGSLGVLDRDGGYLYDALPARKDLLYARAVAVLDDGRLLLTDSGTKGDEHAPAQTSLFVLEPGDDAPSGKSGAWSSDHAEQEFRFLHVAEHHQPKDTWVLYSASPILGGGSLSR